MIYQARYIPFHNVRQYTQINVHFIKMYCTVRNAYGCTELGLQKTQKWLDYYIQCGMKEEFYSSSLNLELRFQSITFLFNPLNPLASKETIKES